MGTKAGKPELNNTVHAHVLSTYPSRVAMSKSGPSNHELSCRWVNAFLWAEIDCCVALNRLRNMPKIIGPCGTKISRAIVDISVYPTVECQCNGNPWYLSAPENGSAFVAVLFSCSNKRTLAIVGTNTVLRERAKDIFQEIDAVSADTDCGCS